MRHRYPQPLRSGSGTFSVPSFLFVCASTEAGKARSKLRIAHGPEVGLGEKKERKKAPRPHYFSPT